MEKALEGVVSSTNEDEISGLSPCLKAEASAGQLDEGGRAPAVAGAAADYPLTVLAADDECSLFEAGNHGDAGGLGRDVSWQALVRGVHEFVQDGVRCFDAVVELLHVGRGRCGNRERHGERRSSAECLNEPFVHHISISLISPDFDACNFSASSAMHMK